jgi:hypothetical protein
VGFDVPGALVLAREGVEEADEVIHGFLGDAVEQAGPAPADAAVPGQAGQARLARRGQELGEQFR